MGGSGRAEILCDTANFADGHIHKPRDSLHAPRKNWIWLVWRPRCCRFLSHCIVVRLVSSVVWFFREDCATFPGLGGETHVHV